METLSNSTINQISLLRTVTQSLYDMSTVINKTFEHQSRILRAAALNIKAWEIQVRKNCFKH